MEKSESDRSAVVKMELQHRPLAYPSPLTDSFSESILRVAPAGQSSSPTPPYPRVATARQGRLRDIGHLKFLYHACARDLAWRASSCRPGPPNGGLAVSTARSSTVVTHAVAGNRMTGDDMSMTWSLANHCSILFQFSCGRPASLQARHRNPRGIAGSPLLLIPSLHRRG
jgi:hypothetical protein